MKTLILQDFSQQKPKHERRKHGRTVLGQAALGQAVLIVTILICIIVLLVVSSSLSVFNQQSAVRNITSKKVLQSYYVAMQGIQEALATRMVPRSNQMNYMTAGGPGSFSVLNIGGRTVSPYYRYSGAVFSDVTGAGAPPVPTAANTLGYYRYLVFGGDAYRNGFTGDYFRTNTTTGFQDLVQSSYFPRNSSPFYIISDGITCVDRLGGIVNVNNGLVAPENRINYAANTKPTCPAASRPQETVLLARVFLERRSATSPAFPNITRDLDQLDALFSFAITPENPRFNIPAPLNTTTPRGAFIPGAVGGDNDANFNFTLNAPGTAIDFEALWNSNQTPRLRKYIFYNAIRSHQATATAASTVFSESVTFGPGDNTNGINIPANSALIPSSASVKLIFDGPIDFRSLYNYDVDACVEGTGTCNVTLTVGGNPQKINFVPVFPGLTSVIITPSYVPRVENTIRLQNIRSFRGDPIPDVQITFTPQAI